MICPNCSQGDLRVFYEALGVPTNSVLLLPGADEARAFPTGNIRLGFCDHCGFAGNTAFDPSLTEYSGRYEPTQAFSPTFNAFHERLALDLIERYDVRDRDVVEIGCGNGEFLTMLCELGANRGIGYDPAYDPDRVGAPPDGVSFVSDFYSAAYRDHGGDFVCCKMTLEHIAEPGPFVKMVREAVLDHATVFFQVPNAAYVFGELAFWDVYYEHCSYFSLGSLAAAFRQAGFEVFDLEAGYDDQYIMVTANPLPAPEPFTAPHDLDELRAMVDRFAVGAAESVSSWKQRFRDWADDDKTVVLWGGGSKAVSFVTTLGLTDEIVGAVDINPRKVGFHLAGSGHPVLGPEQLREIDPDVVVVMNPVYVPEITRMLHDDLALSPEVTALT